MVHLKRYIASLAVVLTLFGAYALAVAPWLEPPPLVRAPSADTLPQVLPRADIRADLDRLFPDGAWERDRPKVVETEQFTLLVKDYQPTPDGKLELTPCTLIFYAAAGRSTDPNVPAPRRPIVLRALQGAVLQFDRPLNIAKAEFGRVLGGRLEGEIKIYSPATSPTARDDLEITTRNIQLDRDKVFTPHEVIFRYGESHGSGRSLQIALLPKDPEDPTGASGIGGVQSLTLENLDRLHLATGGSGLGAGLVPGAKAKRVPATDSPPLEVRCRGPFVFDLLQEVAMFDEGVQVERVNPVGPPDTLRCDRLLLHLGELDSPQASSVSTRLPMDGLPSTAGAAAEAATAAPALSSRLQKIVAIGSPATLDAPSSATAASAAQIVYSLAERRLALIPSKTVSQVALRQESNQFTAHELEYEMAAPGRLGRLWAAGPGQVKFVQGVGAEQRTIVARWEQELRIRPDQRNQVISLIEQASITVEPLGQFSADELHVWVMEVPKASGGRQSPGNVASQPDDPNRREADASRSPLTILPDRLLATGNVRCDAPQIHAETDRLEAWFLNRPPEPAAPAQPNPRVVIGPPREARPIRPPSMQKFDVRGDVVQMQLLVRGPQPELEDLTIKGQAVITESRTPEPGQEPLRIAGDALELHGAATGAGKIDVVGQPAEVTGRGMSLASGTIHVLRSENRLWIDGPGEAKLPVPIPAPAAGTAPPPPQPVHVVWQESLTFDGRVATVEGDVHVRSATQLVTSPTLEATLVQRLDFLQPQAREAAELATLKFDGGVFVENRGLNAVGEQVSLDRGQVKDLTFNRAAGTLHAEGPGWVSSTRLGTAELPGANGAPAPGAGIGRPPLTYVHIAFAGSIEGELAKREIQFRKQVRTTYAPVNDWEERVVAERLADLGERGVLLNSDTLTVTEMILPGARWIETSATGNTVVEGQTFTVQAPKILYSSDKQVLTLEGDGRADAELWYQTVPGKPQSYASARKWRYWLQSGLFDVEDAKVFDLQQLGTGIFRLPGARR